MGGVLDARVDQYALAVIAYEMLAGEMAFDGSGAVADVARRVLTARAAVRRRRVAGGQRGALPRHGARRRGSLSVGGRVRRGAAARRRRSRSRRCPSATGADDELPPLAGEATRITVADAQRAADAAAADAEDPPAPPPEDAAPTKEPRTPTIPSPRAGARRRDLRDAGGAEQRGGHRRARAPLPSLSTLVVQKLSATADAACAPEPPQPRAARDAEDDERGDRADRLGRSRRRRHALDATRRRAGCGSCVGIFAGMVARAGGGLFPAPLTRDSFLSY